MAHQHPARPCDACVICAGASLLLTACDRHDTSTPGGAAQKAAEDMCDATKDAANKTDNGLKKVKSELSGSDIKSRAEAVGDKAKEVVTKTGDTVKEAADKAGQAIDKVKQDLNTQNK